MIPIIVQPQRIFFDAQAVCDKLGIKLHKINFAAEYWDNVFEHFLTEYKAWSYAKPGYFVQ